MVHGVFRRYNNYGSVGEYGWSIYSMGCSKSYSHGMREFDEDTGNSNDQRITIGAFGS
jgi:hypothetical protein